MEPETAACRALLDALAQSADRLRDLRRRLTESLGIHNARSQTYLAVHLDGWQWQAWVEATLPDGSQIEWLLDLFVRGDVWVVESTVSEPDGTPIQPFEDRVAHDWREVVAHVRDATEELVASLDSTPAVRSRVIG